MGEITVIEKGKISALQMEFMMVPAILATGVLSIPSMTARFSEHDMWMTPFLGSLIGFLTVYIAWKLHQLYPKMTPIQYSEIILGKSVGKIVGLFLVLFYIHNTGLTVREYADFITGNVMRETPAIVFSISILFVSALAARGGIEVIARSAVICTTLFMVTSLSLLLLLKDIDVTYMLPILENGIVPVIKGSFVQQGWFSEFFVLSFIFPFITNQKKSLKSGMKASLYIMIIFVYVHFFVLTLLADTAINHFYPVYTIVRSISALGFFENFEVIITASWVLGNFVKVSVFFYVASLGLAQLLRLSDYRIIVFPLSLLTVFFSFWNIPNIVYLINYMTIIQPFYLVTVQTVFPLFLLLIALARRKRSEKS